MEPVQLQLTPALCVFGPTLLGILMLLVIWYVRGRAT
jgi:hypothetical protein